MASLPHYSFGAAADAAAASSSTHPGFRRDAYERLMPTPEVLHAEGGASTHTYALGPAEQALLGIRCAKVGLAHVPYPALGSGVSLRGAVALEDIAAGEEFCAVPIHALVSRWSVANSSLAPLLLQSRHQAIWRGDETHALAVFMLREGARAASIHAPYVLGVVGSVNLSTPRLWEDDDTRLRALSPTERVLRRVYRQGIDDAHRSLTSTGFAALAHALSEGVAECGDGLCSAEQLGTIYSLERFRRIVATIESRAYAIRTYEADGEDAAESPWLNRRIAAPMLDYFNFGEVGVRKWFSPTRHEMIASATRPIRKGTELLHRYADECADLLKFSHTFGFVPASASACAAGGHAAVDSLLRGLGEGTGEVVEAGLARLLGPAVLAARGERRSEAGADAEAAPSVGSRGAAGLRARLQAAITAGGMVGLRS